MANTFPASGSTGVGTTTPDATLQVVGDVSITHPSFAGRLYINFLADNKVGFSTTGPGGIGTFMTIGPGNIIDYSPNQLQSKQRGAYLRSTTGGIPGLDVDTILITPGAAAGKVLTSDASGNGTWQTPAGAGSSGGVNSTLTNTTNIAASTFISGSYIQVGSVVHVNIYCTIKPTVTGATTVLTFTLPVSTTNTNQGAGLGIVYVGAGNDCVGTIGITSGTTGQFTFYSKQNSAQNSTHLLFQYRTS